MAHLSTTKKLDGIHSWSLPAISTCPGARDKNGDLVPVCQGCYATEGHYRFSRVINARERNRTDWKRRAWVDEMTQLLHNDRYFRWFDSGDAHTVAMTTKICQAITNTPWVQHWLPTRSYKIPKLNRVLDTIRTLPNVVVRNSADEIDQRAPGTHSSMVISPGSTPPDDVFICPAYKTSPAKCNGCRACWDPTIKVIGYPAHGQKIKKLLPKNSPVPARSIVANAPSTT